MSRLGYRLRTIRRIVVLLTVPLLAHAADPQPYTVALPPTGEAPLDTALHDSATLISLEDKAPVGPFALIGRARGDRDRLQAALGSFGHYDGKIGIKILGRDIDDPELASALQAAAGPVEVAITVTPGPTYTLRKLDLTGPADPAAMEQARDAIKLAPGDPARAADVLAAQSRMLAALRGSGHALAKVGTPDARLDPATKSLDITWRVEAGPAVNLGPISVSGLDDVDEAYVRRRLLIHQGQPFDPAKIETARQDLAATGVFSTVQAKEAGALDPAGAMPIDIDVTERPRRVVGFNAAFSTDLGASAGVTWSHRNLFGQAERLDLGAAITQLGGSASRGSGYNVTAALTKPDVFRRDQSVTVSLQAIKEDLDAYNRTAFLAGVQGNRKLTEFLTATAGVQAQQSHITQEGVSRDYTLLGLPFGLRYDSTGPEGLFEPTHGFKAAAIVTPTAALAAGSDFVIAQLSGSTYINLGAPGRSVLALRATLGTIQGASTFQVPPDQRFYAGGSGTVRGYKYQYVSPKFPSGRPTGGTSLGAATVEYRQRFGESFGAAVFVDAGQVDTGSTPFQGNLRAGAGVGARYYTPIGPIRLDVALPLNKQRGDDTFELYIGIGQAF